MSFSASFSISYNVAQPTCLLITDTSTGTDGSIAARWVYLTLYDGTTLVPSGTTTDYILWPSDELFINPSVFTKDYAAHVIVLWVDSNGDTLYTSDQWLSFDLNNRLGLFSQCKKAVSNPIIIQDRNYNNGLMQAFVYLYAAKDAIEVGADLFKAQSALDKCKEMMDNPTKYF